MAYILVKDLKSPWKHVYAITTHSLHWLIKLPVMPAMSKIVDQTSSSHVAEQKRDMYSIRSMVEHVLG